MTKTCEEFELDLVMREHGALVPAATAALDEHLVGCAECRHFADGGSDVEDVLRRVAARDVQRVDWARLRAGVRSLQRGHRLKMWLAPLFLLQLPLVVLLGTGRLPTGALLFLGPPLTVAFYVGWVWLVSRPFREIMAVVTSESDLLLAYERELRRRQVRARIFTAVNVALALVGAASVVTAGDGSGRVSGVVVALAFGGRDAGGARRHRVVAPVRGPQALDRAPCRMTGPGTQCRRAVPLASRLGVMRTLAPVARVP